MQRTYTITPGAQYDPAGVTIEYGDGRYSAVSVGYYIERGNRHETPGKSNWSGSRPNILDFGQVGAAVRRVSESRVAETLTLGEAAPKRPAYTPDPRLLACRLWTEDEGCVLHGELCREEQDRDQGSFPVGLPED